MENPEDVASQQQWEGWVKWKAGETDVQWTQDKLRQSGSGEGKGGKDVAGQWDEKWKETATWASDHKATRPPITHSTILALCSTVLMTTLCKANSPAIPLALPSGATGVLKCPEEVGGDGGGGYQVHCARARMRCVCAKCLCQVMNADVSALLALLTAPVLPAPPCPPPAAEEADEREATVGLTFNNWQRVFTFNR